MLKIKNLLLSVLFILLVLCSIVMITINRTASAEALEEVSGYNQDDEGVANLENEVTPYLFTTLSLSMNGGGGKVWTTVKNEFTLFPSTVIVILELYSSNTYQENYQNMTLVGTNYIADLDINKTLSVTCSTGGTQKYWQGRMRYKINSQAWKESNTGTLLYDGDGNFLGYI